MFEGDNGGATSKGVTATEIRIGFPVGPGNFELQAKLLAEWFNQRYEFYGRKIVPVIFPNVWFTDPTRSRAAAAEMEAANVFGSIDMFRGVPPSYHAAMARAKIVTVAVGYESLLDDRTTYDQLHPYIWGVYPSIEQVSRNFVSFACTSLVGRPARHAPDFASTSRKFGVVSMGSYRTPYIGSLVQGLSACGAEPQVVKIDSAAGSTTDKIRNTATAFQAAGVTSLICACADSSYSSVARQMADAGFRPELLHPMFAFGPGDEESQVNGWMRDAKYREMSSRTFGMTPTQHIQPYQAYPWFPLHFALTPSGSSDHVDHDPRVMEVMYRQVQVLAAGMQMAGPNLTPDTFAAGLMAAQFPNTGAGAAPLYQPSVGFGPGDHTFYNDYALAWWGQDAEPYQWGCGSVCYTVGSWCYMDRGARYTIGTFPSDADSRFYSPSEPCR